ncbi:MAG: nuclear transport factor 2 family protein [Sphingomonadaceae bacterium]|nr:nuclear transport factor 2 family protein [Sphingomonadaceae bacterium]
MATSENIALVRRFIASWSTLDIDQIVEFFADDGVYHNMPIAPVQGKATLRAFIAAFINGWSATDWDILHIMGAGDIVIAERLDRTQVGDKKVDLPCCGVFELRDGKIALWRDYFDMATYRNALA